MKKKKKEIKFYTLANSIKKSKKINSENYTLRVLLLI